MGLFKNILRALWRAWFYLLTALITILMIPVLLVLTSSERWYSAFYWVARHLWAIPILYGMGFRPVIRRHQPLEKGKSYMLVANHTSMTDIMLMLVCSTEPFVFVGKKELSKMPIFGYFYKRVSILVDRSDRNSRKRVYDQAVRRLDAGLSICIFPEGGVPDDGHIVLDTFKDGAFRIAIEYQIPIVPMVFFDNKERFPFSFAGSPGIMRALIHPFVATEGLTLHDKVPLRERVRNIILHSLENIQW